MIKSLVPKPKSLGNEWALLTQMSNPFPANKWPMGVYRIVSFLPLCKPSHTIQGVRYKHVGSNRVYLTVWIKWGWGPTCEFKRILQMHGHCHVGLLCFTYAPHTIQTNEEDRLSLKKMMIGGTLTSSSSSSSSTAKIILEAFPAEMFRRGGASAEIFPRKTSHLKLLRVDSVHGRILKPIPLRSSSIKVTASSMVQYFSFCS